MIPFNKTYSSGRELLYIEEVIRSGKTGAGGDYSHRCVEYFEKKYGFIKCFLTNSCTAALEVAALLCQLEKDDEVIIPSYSYVTSANAFALFGAKPVFADSNFDNPNIDHDKIESLVTSKTKAIIVMHYGGISCNMKKIMDIAERNHLFVIEDNASGIDSYYQKRPLGSIGQFGAVSFHETKNISAGEAGLLIVNDEKYISSAEMIIEKGTNKMDFIRGLKNKYEWTTIGSSFAPSEITAACLFAQLENMDVVQNKRKSIWQRYYDKLKPLSAKAYFKLPSIPDYATNNGHLFYLVCINYDVRNKLLDFLKQNMIQATFHYLSLHKSPYYRNEHIVENLPMSDLYSENLIRLPLYYDLSDDEIDYITGKIGEFVSLYQF